MPDDAMKELATIRILLIVLPSLPLSLGGGGKSYNDKDPVIKPLHIRLNLTPGQVCCLLSFS